MRIFAEDLRAVGLDAWLDVYEVAPAEGWPRWMHRQLRDADVVIFICTATYRRRFEGEAEADVGRGVSWEGLLATQMMYDAGLRDPAGRFVPLLLEGHLKDAVPLPLRAFGALRWPVDRERLLRRLYGEPEVTPPPLRPRPALSGGLATEPLAALSASSTLSAPSTLSTQRAGSSAEALPPGLEEAYLAGELVVFAGADVSLAAGLPAGGALPPTVLREAEAYLEREDFDELDREVKAALADGTPAEALGHLAHVLGRPTFNGIVAHVLDDRLDPPRASPIATALAALAPALRGILTTNVDHLLERALLGRELDERWSSHPQVTANLDARPHWIAHLRGALGEDPRAWTFTEGGLRLHLHQRPLVAELVRAQLMLRSVLFVGFNLNDPDIAELLARVAMLTEGCGRRHFALVDASNARSLRSQRRRDLLAAGVVVVPCGHEEGAFSGVVRVLAVLARLQECGR